MSAPTPDPLARSPGQPAAEWQRRYPADWRPRSRGSGSGLLLAGLALAGLGALAWYYLGPDLRRYLKIRSM
jgi:hypothetical protein